MRSNLPILIENKEVVLLGTFPRIAGLKAEYYEYVQDPAGFAIKLKTARIGADLFTFLQETPQRAPKYQFHVEWDSIAVLPITTYEHWWETQVNDKTRNMVRKAARKGVEVRLAEYTEQFVRGIM